MSVPALAGVTGVVNGPDDAIGIMHAEVARVFGEAEWPTTFAVINRESSWNPNAVNRHDGACGLVQAMPCPLWPWPVAQQADWFCNYVIRRYGDPINAWKHETQFGWY